MTDKILSFVDKYSKFLNRHFMALNMVMVNACANLNFGTAILISGQGNILGCM